jgi:hypothetical protein
MAEQEDLNELWNELLDCVQEMKGDLKDSLRSRRHLKNLERTVGEVGQALFHISKQTASKRRFI